METASDYAQGAQDCAVPWRSYRKVTKNRTNAHAHARDYVNTHAISAEKWKTGLKFTSKRLLREKPTRSSPDVSRKASPSRRVQHNPLRQLRDHATATLP